MKENEFNRRLAAILAADVVGYSRLVSADEVGSIFRLSRLRREIIEPHIVSHAGRMFKIMGDGFLAEFASAVQAVSCAIAIQAATEEEASGFDEARKMRLRIGIHVGDVMVEGEDLLGDGINIAARLEGIAAPGGIIISRAVHDQVRDRLKIAFEDKGDVILKNISRPIRVFTVGETRTSTSFHPITPAVALPDKPSIAVLPFENISGDPEQEYFADGMIEDIITALSKFKSLLVIARNSSFAYKQKPIDIRKVGRDLGVRYVLEGSVRKSKNRVRVTGQLIEATTNRHLWSDKFDGSLDDIFDLQDQITAAVVGLIAPQIEDVEIQRARKKLTNNLDSYDFYLRGLAQHYDRNWVEALQSFRMAYESDATFAAAYAMSAITLHMQQVVGGELLTADSRAEALKLANIAARIGNDDAFVLARCGHVLVHHGQEFERGASMVEKAIMLNPNLATARSSYGWISVVACEPERAIENFQSMIRFSPLEYLRVGATAGIAWALWLQGRYEEGLTLAGSVTNVYPNVQSFGSLLANCVAAGHVDDAKLAAAELIKISPDLNLVRAQEMFPLRKIEFRSKLDDALRLAGLPE